MNIEFEELTHQNFSDACNIDRDDIPEDFVDTASTIMNITDYGLNHHCMGHTFVVTKDIVVAALAEKYWKRRYSLFIVTLASVPLP